MGRIKTIARRSFLIGSAAVVGGVAFGVYKLKEEAPNPLSPAQGQYALNPFVIIDQNGVTLIAPKAEMGQGVHTTWAALLAEELDVDWEDITVLHGPPAKAYYNSALFGLALPFRDYKVTDFGESLRGFVGDAAKLLDLQLTGGSTSMKDGFERMREAGAAARETLKLAAADRWNLSVDDLTTASGKVTEPDGKALSYQELAEAASKIDPPNVDLRDPSQWRFLGKSMPRVDMIGKVTGTTPYSIDTRLPDMRFATVRMNPARSGMVSFDATEAASMAGVEKVIDLGDGIAVVANNTWLAIQAAEAVEIEWEPATYPKTNDALLSVIAASFDAKPNTTARDDGDVDKAVEGTEITAEYSVPWLAHASMEPMNATALYTGDSLQIWSGNQSPTSTQDSCAAAVGLEPNQVSVETTMMGGAFGRRGETDFSVLAARVAQAIPGVPLNVTWSREEDMRHDMYRPAALARFRGVVKDGKAVLLDGKIAGHSVIKAAGKRTSGQETPGPDREHVTGAYDQPYAIDNYRIAGHLAQTDLPVGYWRSVGASSNGFFFESFIDELAHAANRDPMAFRLEMAQAEHEPTAQLFEALAEMSGWTGTTPAGVGRGVAMTYSFGSPVGQVIEVRDTDQGIRISKVWIACDVGVALDPRNIEAQMTGACVFGLSAAVQGEITFADGAAEQYNYPDYDLLRMHTAPEFEVKILQNNRHIGGVGEPGTPPAAPALANALFDLTGRRARSLPLYREFDLIL